MKKLMFAFFLATAVAGTATTTMLYANETNAGAGTLVLPAGFLTINGDPVSSIDLGSNGSAVLRGHSTQTSVQIVMDAPGRQGGHMSQTEDYMVAGMNAGNALFFDPATATLYIVILTKDAVTVVKETVISAQ